MKFTFAKANVFCMYMKLTQFLDVPLRGLWYNGRKKGRDSVDVKTETVSVSREPALLVAAKRFAMNMA